MKAFYKLITYCIIIFLFQSIQLIAQDQNSENQMRLAKSFESRGMLLEAEEIYSELHAKQPINFQYYSALKNNLKAQKKYSQAKELIQNQLKISRNLVVLFGDLGSVYFHLGKEEEALEAWEKGVEVESNNAFAFRTIANNLIEHRLLEKAIEFLQRGNDVADDKTIFSYDIANYYSITMKFEEAAKEYCKILTQKRKQINLVKTRINSYINSNLAAEPTIKTIKEFYDNTEDIIFLELLSHLYSRVGQHEEALGSQIEIEKSTTKNGSTLFKFAQQSALRGNPGIAAKAYKVVVDDYPESALISEAEIGFTRAREAELNLENSSQISWKPFQIHRESNNSDFLELLEAYKQLVKKYPKSKVGDEAEFRVAKIYLYELSDLNKADSIYNKILKTRRAITHLAESQLGLAVINIAQNNLSVAINHLNNIISGRLAKENVKREAQFLIAKVSLWNGEFSKAILEFNKVINNKKEVNVNDALQYSLILNTFKNDSTNLFSFANADYLLEKKAFKQSLAEFEKLANNENLFLMKDFAAIKYIELLLALNNYQEASIFLEKKSNCDEDNIYKDRFLYLLGANYFYGLNNGKRALTSLTKILDNFPNSIYYNKARQIISEINLEVNNSI